MKGRMKLPMSGLCPLETGLLLSVLVILGWAGPSTAAKPRRGAAVAKQAKSIASGRMEAGSGQKYNRT
ncbi:Uncharacterized protein HZ326_10935 [Fusarium oxysporum f. sp. albedinis]|nr:Uncharacterized protein HZ326_10935 [Fusarium oxysporum f. sp. albedinis]